MFSGAFELDAVIANFVYSVIWIALQAANSANSFAIPLLAYSYVLLRQFLALKTAFPESEVSKRILCYFCISAHHNAQTKGKFITLIEVSVLLSTKSDIMCEHLLMGISV